MRRPLLAALLGFVAVSAAAQVKPRGTTANPPAGIPKVINVTDQPYGAVATLATFQTTAIQSAINAACAITQNGVGTIPGIVFIPAGAYAISTLDIPCSGLTLRGANIGALTTQGTTLAQAGSGATAILTVGSTGAVKDVTIEDLTIQAVGDANNTGGLDLTCQNCHINRVGINAYNVFGIRFLGASSLTTGGFTDVNQCVIENGRSNSFAIVNVTQTGAAGGPDGNSFVNCYFNTPSASATGAGWVNDSTVAGATSLRSSQAYIGNRFETNNNNGIIAFQGNRQDDRIIGNRFENTGTGAVTVSLANAISTDPSAYFLSNLWACGPGLCSWTDNATTKAIRIGELFGPSTNARPPGVLLSDASATSSGAGSPVTLKSYTLPANSVNASGSTMLRIRAWGHTANNANAKTTSVVFGGVTLITITETISAADQWACDVTVAFRTTGSAAQSVGGDCSQGATGTVATPVTATPTLDFTIANAIAVSVTQVSAADMVQDGMIVILCGAAGAAGC